MATASPFPSVNPHERERERERKVDRHVREKCEKERKKKANSSLVLKEVKLSCFERSPAGVAMQVISVPNNCLTPSCLKFVGQWEWVLTSVSGLLNNDPTTFFFSFLLYSKKKHIIAVLEFIYVSTHMRNCWAYDVCVYMHTLQLLYSMNTIIDLIKIVLI